MAAGKLAHVMRMQSITSFCAMVYHDLYLPHDDVDGVVHRMRLGTLLAMGYGACCTSQSVSGQVTPADRCADSMTLHCEYSDTVQRFREFRLHEEH